MRHIHFHDISPPAEIGAPEAEGLLTQVAIRDKAGALTQNDALGAPFLAGSQPQLIPAR